MTPPHRNLAVETIPTDFARRAEEYVARTGQPLLEHTPSPDDVVLLAIESCDEYQLALADWKPPFRTWREYAAYVRDDIEGLLEERGLDLGYADRAVEVVDLPEFWEQLLRPYDTDLGRAFVILQSLAIPRRFTAEDTNAELGSLDFTDGAYPGDEYVGVTASSALALSCLQHALDACTARIAIQVG